MNDQIIVFGLLLRLVAGSNSTCASDKQLLNTVVYQGNSSSFSNQFDPNNVKWEVTPSFVPDGSPSPPYTIADGNSVRPGFNGSYAVNSTQLTIPFASASEREPYYSYPTAGLYTLTYNSGGCQSQANLIVVKFEPLCGCRANYEAGGAFLECEFSYAVYRMLRNNVTVTWYDASGTQVPSVQPDPREVNEKYLVLISTLSITSSDVASYECRVTFTAPEPGVSAYMATNAPNFTASCRAESSCAAPVPAPAPTTAIETGTLPPTTGIATTAVGTVQRTPEIGTTTTGTAEPTSEIHTTSEGCRDTCSYKWFSNLKAFCPHVQQFRDDCPAYCGK